MRFGSLFSGIGGMDLGLERAGMECAWQVEIDGYCRKILSKHWPNVQRFNDVRECGIHNLEQVDLIVGGFPCQDISNAGKRAGIDGSRSGLWSEFHRIICELRPRNVLVENVAALLVRGMDRVLGDLAASGYDAEWDCLPAAAFGAYHIRDRLFVLAYSQQNGRNQDAGKADCRILGGAKTEASGQRAKKAIITSNCCQGLFFIDDEYESGISNQEDFIGLPERPLIAERWFNEPTVVRVVNGVSDQLDGIAALGNAVVPQVAEWIGKRIMEVANK